MAEHAEHAYERATLVFAIGDLGGTPRRRLDDPNAAVRGCAALAEALADDEAATRVLLEPARSPCAFRESLGDSAPPPQYMVPPYPGHRAEALLRRHGGCGTVPPA